MRLPPPAKSRRSHRIIPEGFETAVEFEKRDRATLHVEARDVVSNQISLDANPLSVEEPLKILIHDVELNHFLLFSKTSLMELIKIFLLELML